MTNEEAIKELKYSYNENITDNEALDIAIKALEQEPCEDAISRQKVLDLCDSKDPDYKVIHFKEDVECLPSVNPQPICEEREKGECPYYAG